MNVKVSIGCFIVIIIAIILSCDKITDEPYQFEPPPDSIPSPQNISTQPIRITTDTMVFDTLLINPLTIDTITEFGLFSTSWEKVAQASMYMVFVYDGEQKYLMTVYTDTTYIVVGQEANETYYVKLAAFQIVTDTQTGDTLDTVYSRRTTFYTPASLWQPRPPKITGALYDSSSLSIQVFWNTDGIRIDSSDVTGYCVYLLDSAGIDTLDKDSVTNSVFTATLSNGIEKNRSYKLTIRTSSAITSGIISDAYTYSDSTAADSGGVDDDFLLSYIYLSTYVKPADIITSINYGMTGVKGGIFLMGDIWDSVSNSEMRGDEFGVPVHEVILSSFYMGKTEITNRHFALFLNGLDTTDFILVIDTTDTVPDTLKYLVKTLNDTLLEQNYKKQFISYSDSSGFKVFAQYDSLPASGIYWKGAAAFCNWLSKAEGLDSCYDVNWTCHLSRNGYRLPTEAEFEYAHSAAFGDNMRSKRRYPWGYGNNAALYSVDTTKGLQKVESFGPFNGFFNLSGNVKEWCSDWTNKKYDSLLVVNPLVIDSPSTNPVIRGGSYKETANANSSTWRHLDPPADLSDCGFRIVRRAN